MSGQIIRGDYGKRKELNFSSLKHGFTSWKLYRHRMENPEPPKPHYLWGRGWHTLSIEPDLFPERFALAGKWEDKDGKIGQVRRNESDSRFQLWQQAHPGREALLPSEWESIHNAAAAVRAHPEARKLLDGSRFEVAIAWACPHTGLALKGRLDAVGRRVVDLKSTGDVSSRKCGKTAADLLYHAQLAMYHDGAREVGLIPRDAEFPAIIWGEKSEPHDVAVDEFDHFAYETGRRCYVRLLEQLKICMKTNTWPGKAPVARTLALPDWAPGAEGDVL